jgi:hypothetical protein
MDAGNYLQTIVNRCAFLMVYYDHPDRRRQVKYEMRAEMRWLSEDARIWDVSRESIDSGLLDELRRSCDEATALRLHRAFRADFASLLIPGPPSHPVDGEGHPPIPDSMRG